MRVSTDEQAKEGYSIRAQIEKLKSYIQIKDWQFYKVYADEGISGKNIIERPAINELIDDIRAGKVNNVLVYKIDRLTRSTRDLIDLTEIFKENNCTFNSLMESIDNAWALERGYEQLESNRFVPRLKEVLLVKRDTKKGNEAWGIRMKI